MGVAVRACMSLYRRFVKTVEAEIKNYPPDGCVLRMTINLPGITFHFVEDVDLVGANNKHLEMAE